MYSWDKMEPARRGTTQIASFFQLHPFLRLLLPWMAGIFCADLLWQEASTLYVGIAAGLFSFAWAVYCYRDGAYAHRWRFGVAVLGFCFWAGWLGMSLHVHATTYDFPPETAIYRAVLTTAPQEKERSWHCPVYLTHRYDSGGAVCSVARRAILYLARDTAAAGLRSGDALLVAARLAPPQLPKGVDSFDYASYLRHRGVAGTGYVPAGKWMQTTVEAHATLPVGIALQEFAGRCRARIIALYRRLGFEGDRLAVLSALTVGDKSALSDAVRESYSTAGASHILALSGLHIGLLHGVFYFLLSGLGRIGTAGRWLRAILLLALLWTFALFTGLSPSVARAVGMFSLWLLADLVHRTPLSLNTLATTAWLLLCFAPAWLFDVGFQLSFSAVAALVLWQRPFYSLFRPRHKAVRYVWGVVSASVVAQLGTAPLVLYYFARFSNHFLLANLGVIPLAALILYTSLLMLVLTPLPALQAPVAKLVDCLLVLLNDFVHLVESLPHATIEGAWLHPLQVLSLYLCLGLLGHYLARREHRRLRAFLLSLLLFGVCRAVLWWTDRPQDSLVFYSARHCPAVHCIGADGESWLCYADSLTSREPVRRMARHYAARHRLSPPVELCADTTTTSLVCRDCWVLFRGYRVCVVTDDRWRCRQAARQLPVDYLYIGSGYGGSVDELSRLFLPTCIVLDSSLSLQRRQQLAEECQGAGLSFLALADEGTVRFVR